MQPDTSATPARLAHSASARVRAVYVERLATFAAESPWNTDAIRALALAVKIVDAVSADIDSAIVGEVVDERNAERVARMSGKRPSWVKRVADGFPA